MKDLLKFLLVFTPAVLVGCGSSSAQPQSQNADPLPTYTAICTGQQGQESALCGAGFEPTAVGFGDSIDLGRAAETRHDLCGVVDFRHDFWDNDGIPLCGKSYSSYAVAQFVSHGINDGCAETQLQAMKDQFAGGRRFNAVIFTAGLHDFQVGTKNHTCGNSTPESFRAAVEKLAALAKSYGDVVIWVNTPPMLPVTTASIPGGIQDIINPIGDDIAREHGFYIAEMNIDPSYHRPDDDHFTRQGYQIMGEWLANCIVLALSGQESDFCHK